MESRFHIDSPFAEHVVWLCNPLSIEKDRTGSVKTFKDKFHMLTREHGRRRINGSPVFPAGFLDPLQFTFVVPIEGVGNLPGLNQVEMYIPRDRCGKPSTLNCRRLCILKLCHS